MPSSRWSFAAMLLATPHAYANAGALPWMTGIILAGLALLLIGLALYCSKLKHHNTRLSQHSIRLHSVMQNSDDCIAILDSNKQTLYLNPAFSALRVANATDSSAILPLYAEQYDGQLLLPQLPPHSQWTGEVWLQTSDQADRQAYEVKLTPMSADADNYLLIARNIHPNKHLKQESIQSYSRDSQTGLYSDHLLKEFLQSFIQFTSDTHPQYALVFVKFSQLLTGEFSKPHAQLPQLLKELAGYLQQLCDKSYIVARFNNDTLAIAIPPHLCDSALELNLTRLGHQIIALPARLADRESANTIQTSVGISIYPIDGSNVTEMMFAASTAAVNAGRQGYNHLCFANSRIQQRAPEYMTLETELRKAVMQGEFELYYQPRVSIGSNRIIGYEALLRWHSPKRGILLPQHFMHMADETGLITQLDKLSFNKCCQQLTQWQKTGVSRGRISLNIASLSFRQADFVSYLTAQLEKYELSGEHFELELHEDILLAEDASTEDTLQQLASLGFHLTLDNFGIGVSSITVLRQYPLHSIKIAASYVKDMEHDEQQRNITASIIRLASYLRLDAIATGIENEMQAYLLHVMGCDILQGHLFSKALPASEIPALLAKENKLIRKEVG